MKILIIDDEKEKIYKEKSIIERIAKNIEIICADNKVDGVRLIKEEHDIKLIILDMNFPEKENGRSIAKMGIAVLDEMEQLGIKVPVIVCSTDPYRIIDENVIGCVQFSYYMDAEFEQLLEKIL